MGKDEIEITRPMILAATETLAEHLDCYLPQGWGLLESVAKAALVAAIQARKSAE